MIWIIHSSISRPFPIVRINATGGYAFVTSTDQHIDFPAFSSLPVASFTLNVPHIKVFWYSQTSCHSERSYVANTLAIVDDGDDSTGRKSSDFKQYEKAIAVTDTYHETRTRFAWVGEIKDKRLQEGLEKLSDEELRLITLYFRDEYSTVELSKVYGIAQQNISKRILKITKFLKKFGFLGVD